MSILSTNNKLIKVGQDYSAGSGISIDDKVISVTGEFGKTYSAGDNIDIYKQDEQLYISSKDWTNDIANASANALNEAISQIPDPFDPTFISGQVDNKLDTTAFTAWQNGQYNTDLQTIEGQISNKLDVSAFNQVSGDFLTAAPADMATTGDVAELAQTISETYQTKGDYATVEDVERATSVKADKTGVIDYFDKPVVVGDYESVWASGGKLHAGYTAEAAYLYAYGNSENFTEISPTCIWTKSANKNTINIQTLSAMTNGFTAAGIEIGQNAGIKIGQNAGIKIGDDEVEISGGGYNGVQIRTPNPAMASAGLYYSANQNVPRYSPVFSAKNASGDGFAIWAGGAKGFDASGNTIWDATAPAKLIGWSNYQGTSIDSRAVGIDGSIIATVYPDQIPNSMAISSAPYSYMNGGGLYACNHGGVKLSVDALQRSITVVVPSLSSTAQMNAEDVSYTKYNNDTSANDVWSLTGSVQKREIEYDADTSAITAIAGSAIGGGKGGNVEVNDYVQNNSATINEVNTTYQANSGSYQPSGNYIPYTAVDNVLNAFETNSGLEFKTNIGGELRSNFINKGLIILSYVRSSLGVHDMATLSTGSLTFENKYNSAYVDMEKIHTWDSASNYIQNISSTYYPKSNPSSFATEEWVTSQGYLTGVSIPESATWNEVSTTVQTNSAQWAEGGGDMFTSYLEYNDQNQISGYNGSALAGGNTEVENYVQTNSATINDVNTSYQTNSGTFLTAQEVSHDNTLSGNGTVESPLGVANDYIKMLSVNQPLTAPTSTYVSTASVPAGYEFLCWVNMCTNGFSQVFYPLNPTSTTCNWWLGGSEYAPHEGGTVDSRYLVIKKA